MTRDEFIDGYMARSGLPAEWRTPEGFKIPDQERANTRVALPCYCGEDVCEGWAMIIGDAFSIKHHIQFYGQRREDDRDRR